jgi:hypothetical protein
MESKKDKPKRRRKMAGVTLREMEEVNLNFDTSDLGNVMSMGPDDSLGLGMLANPMKTADHQCA